MEIKKADWFAREINYVPFNKINELMVYFERPDSDTTGVVTYKISHQESHIHKHDCLFPKFWIMEGFLYAYHCSMTCEVTLMVDKDSFADKAWHYYKNFMRVSIPRSEAYYKELASSIRGGGSSTIHSPIVGKYHPWMDNR